MIKDLTVIINKKKEEKIVKNKITESTLCLVSETICAFLSNDAV